MESLIIENTNKTPKVFFNALNGKMELTGRSIPENSFQFYEPLLQWIDEYSKSPQEHTQFSFRLDYFNTSSSMYILGILKKLERLHLDGKVVKVFWHYDSEDEDMLQTGEDLKQIVKIPIEMTESEG
jgi:SiaC family regulatory phosphoprotein